MKYPAVLNQDGAALATWVAANPDAGLKPLSDVSFDADNFPQFMRWLTAQRLGGRAELIGIQTHSEHGLEILSVHFARVPCGYKGPA